MKQKMSQLDQKLAYSDKTAVARNVKTINISAQKTNRCLFSCVVKVIVAIQGIVMIVAKEEQTAPQVAPSLF